MQPSSFEDLPVRSKYQRIFFPLLLIFVELAIINLLGWGKLMEFHANPSALISLISYMPYVVRGFVVGALVMCFLLSRNWSQSIVNKSISSYQPTGIWIGLNLTATFLLAVFFLTIPSASEFNALPIGPGYFLYLVTPLIWLIWFASAVAWFYPPRQIGTLVRRHWGLLLIIVVISLFARGTVPGELPLEIYNKALYFWSELFLEPTLYVAMAVSNIFGLNLEYWNDATGLLTFGNSVYNVGILGDCSGYEGITLVAVLLGVYCFLEKRTLKMPQALLIFPLAMLSMFLLNALRLIILIEIGVHWSPEIAMAGFHPVAGWVNLIATLIVSALFLNKSSFFARPIDEVATDPRALSIPQKSAITITGLNNNSAPLQDNFSWESQEQLKYFLMPMVVWIGASLLTQMFSLEFRWLYPIPVLMVGTLLYYYRDNYLFLRAKLSAVPILVGILVFGVWIVLIPPDLMASSRFEASLFSVSPVLTALWLVFRILGTTVMVPILEELAFRGFMQPQIQAFFQDRLRVSRAAAIFFALALTSLAFGLMHSDWIAGTVAGIFYGLLRLWRGKVGDAIVAHGVTNFILAMYILFFGYWSYF